MSITLSCAIPARAWPATDAVGASRLAGNAASNNTKRLFMGIVNWTAFVPGASGDTPPAVSRRLLYNAHSTESYTPMQSDPLMKSAVRDGLHIDSDAPIPIPHGRCPLLPHAAREYLSPTHHGCGWAISGDHDDEALRQGLRAWAGRLHRRTRFIRSPAWGRFSTCIRGIARRKFLQPPIHRTLAQTAKLMCRCP